MRSSLALSSSHQARLVDGLSRLVLHHRVLPIGVLAGAQTYPERRQQRDQDHEEAQRPRKPGRLVISLVGLHAAFLALSVYADAGISNVDGPDQVGAEQQEECFADLPVQEAEVVFGLQVPAHRQEEQDGEEHVVYAGQQVRRSLDSVADVVGRADPDHFEDAGCEEADD